MIRSMIYGDVNTVSDDYVIFDRIMKDTYNMLL